MIPLFNGIGGAFRCYDLLGLSPLHLVAFDIHAPAQRVTSRRWPRAELLGDVRNLDESMVLRWLTEYLELDEIHLWGGFPCVDLSSVNSQGLGLRGQHSSLFYSMPKSECDAISSMLGEKPTHLDCVQAVPMRRPRLCWCSEPVGYNVDGVTVKKMEHWDEVHATAEYPSLEAWIGEGADWPGYHAGFALPTALKSIRRMKPPPDPAGLNRCNSDAIARWTSYEYRFPPYLA